MKRIGAIGLGSVLAITASAQDLAPFTTPLDQFFVFDAGRFVELEPRKPLQFVVAGDRLIYIDHAGAIKVYSGGQVNLVEAKGPYTLVGAGSEGLVGYTAGSSIGMVRSTGPVVLSGGMGYKMSVSDSLIAWEEMSGTEGAWANGMLNVCWRNKVYPVSEIVPRVILRAGSWTAIRSRSSIMRRTRFRFSITGTAHALRQQRCRQSRSRRGPGRLLRRCTTAVLRAGS
jgi:hypothetical protein